MQSPNDWKNVEMTGYVRYEEGKDNQNFAWYARGGKHTDSEDCEGSAYKGQLFFVITGSLVHPRPLPHKLFLVENLQDFPHSPVYGVS
jgi:hypothetical protein